EEADRHIWIDYHLGEGEDTARGGGAADIGGSFATGTRLAACDGRRPAGASSNAGQAKRG
ncbi:hypothetical protein AB0K61_33985, partial [Streptomyces syringium]|uniref:hypothetical protein n=1 Tax=Streptomyces syringium TaxID=76729 RepID=UPI0034243696